MIRGENRHKLRRASRARTRGTHARGYGRVSINDRDVKRYWTKKKKTWSNKQVYRRRRQAAVLILFAILLLPLSILTNSVLGSEAPGIGQAGVKAVDPPLFSAAPIVLTRPAKAEEQSPGQPPPKDHTLSLTVPKLGIYGHTVRNDASPAALDQGAIKLPSSGFPWQKNANTYIAGHRIGYKDTESYYEFLDLPTMQKGDEVFLEDANGKRYVYQVSKVFAVTPQESWVTAPVPGKDMVTLQTCVESVDDWWTIGNELMTSSPSTGRLIVRAERVN